MKKIEMIWRELLNSTLKNNIRRFEQKALAQKFGFSTSTVFQALKIPRQMGAVRITGRFFVLEDPEKLLYHWASVRNIESDILDSLKVDGSILETEAKMPPEVIFGAYSAARMTLSTPPADYDKVYVYASDIEKIKERFEIEKGTPNLFVLKSDEFLSNDSQITGLAQTFVDLWNLKDWYAKEYAKAIKEKIDAILSVCYHRVMNIDETKNKLSKQKAYLSNNFYIKNIGVFGSVAKNEARETSDIDLLVEFTKPVGFFHFSRLEDYLSGVLNKKVDLATKDSLKPAIKDDILKDVVYV